MTFVAKSWVDDPNSPVSPTPGTTPISAAALIDLETRLSTYTDGQIASHPGGHAIQNEGSLLTTRAGLNFQGGGVAAVDDAGNARTNIKVLDEKVWITDPAFAGGADPTGTADSAAAIAAAYTAAAGASKPVVASPPGLFKILSSLTQPDGVSTIGSSARNTAWWWPNDLTGTAGAAVYGLTQAAAQWPSIIRGIYFKGPGTSNVHGVFPANMSGILMAAGGWVDECYWTGWYSGVVNNQNHEVVTNSRCGSNGYGVYRTNVGSLTGGNQYFANMVLDNNNIAAFGVHGARSYDAVKFLNLHLANSPFGFYGEADLGAQLFNSADLDTVAFEGINNGLIYAPGLRGLNNLHCHGCTEASSFSGPVGTLPAPDYAIQGYNVSIYIDNGFFSAVGNKGCIKAAGDLSGWWQDFQNAYDNAETATKPVFTAGSSVAGFYGKLGTGDITYKVEQPTTNSGTIAKNDLLAQRFDTQVQRNSGAGSNGFPIGAALQPDYGGTYSQAMMPTAQRGRILIPTSDATLNSGGPYWVKPDTANAGKVVAAANANDGPIVGIAVANASAGKVLVRLRGLGG